MAYKETLASPKFDNKQSQTTYEISAGVGLLSRNIKITSQPSQTNFGFRLLVADYTGQRGRTITNYKGIARISNVEMNGPGQAARVKTNSWLGDYDSGIVFKNAAAGENYVVNSTLHRSLGSGLTVAAGSGAVRIEGNVMHGGVGWSIRVAAGAGSCAVRRNLVLMTYASGIQLGGSDNYFGAIDVRRSVSLAGNMVAGSELVGVRCPGVCASANKKEVDMNEVYASAAGVVVFEEQLKCSGDSLMLYIRNFLVFRSSEYGVYYQRRSAVSVFGSILVENQIGVFTMVNGPSVLAHELGKGVCFVEECVIVGRVGNDSECMRSRNGDRPIMEAFGAGQNGTGMIGVVWASFVSYGNGGPVLSWSSSRSYSQISGDMRVSYTTFAHFSPRYV